MTTIKLRSATESDLDAVVDMINRYGIKMYGMLEETRESMSEQWTMLETHMPGKTAIVESIVDRNVLGHGIMTTELKRGTVAKAKWWIEQEHDIARTKRVCDILMEWYLGEIGNKHVNAQIIIDDRDLVSIATVMAHGFIKSHAYCEMVIDLTSDRIHDVVPPPDGITFEIATDKDIECIVDTKMKAFAGQWDFDILSRDEEIMIMTCGWLGMDKSMWTIAKSKSDIVGFCICNPCTIADERSGYIKFIAVLESWRGRGIGSALLERAFYQVNLRGKTKCRLTVLVDNPTSAIKLYKKAGMVIERESLIFEKST